MSSELRDILKRVSATEIVKIMKENAILECGPCDFVTTSQDEFNNHISSSTHLDKGNYLTGNTRCKLCGKLENFDLEDKVTSVALFMCDACEVEQYKKLKEKFGDQ